MADLEHCVGDFIRGGRVLAKTQAVQHLVYHCRDCATLILLPRALELLHAQPHDVAPPRFRERQNSRRASLLAGVVDEDEPRQVFVDLNAERVEPGVQQLADGIATTISQFAPRTMRHLVARKVARAQLYLNGTARLRFDPGNPTFSVAPDERWIVFTQLDSWGSDIEMIDGFR